jgi:hypothetical protein
MIWFHFVVPGPSGITTYRLSDCPPAAAELLEQVRQNKTIEVYNTAYCLVAPRGAGGCKRRVSVSRKKYAVEDEMQ